MSGHGRTGTDEAGDAEPAAQGRGRAIRFTAIVLALTAVGFYVAFIVVTGLSK